MNGSGAWGSARCDSASAIPQYIIINLRNRTAEVYEQPNTAVGTYPPPRVIREDESLPLRVGENETLDLLLSNLLP